MQFTSLPSVTQAQATRMQIIVELGCVACLLQSRRVHTESEIHYLLAGGVRIDHWHTLALCCWHRLGVVPSGLTEELCRRRRGPSLAREPKVFSDLYGDDAELLEKQNEFLKRYCMHVGLKAHLKKIIEGQVK